MPRRTFVPLIFLAAVLSLLPVSVAKAQEQDCGGYAHCAGYIASKGSYQKQTCCLPVSGTYNLAGQTYSATNACPGDWYKTVGNCTPASQFICCAKTLPGTSASTAPQAGAPAIKKLIVPKLNVAIPGLNFSSDFYEEEGVLYVPFLGQYISAFFSYILGVALIATAIMLIWGGILYVYGATGLQVSDAKKKMTDAIVGLIIILGSYVILANINPNLTKPAGIKIGVVKAKPYVLMGAKEYTAAIKEAKPQFKSNLDKVPPDENAIFSYVEQRAKELGINVCVAKGIVRSESGGNPNAVNHNENYDTIDAQERVDFLRGSLKYSGAGFSVSMPSDCSASSPGRTSCISLALTGPKNDDSEKGDPSKIDGGFDWKWSHDFGLGMINIGTLKGGSWCSPPTPSRKIGNQCFTWFDLLTAKGAIEAMLSHPALRGSNPDSMARGYVGQNCGPGCAPYDLKFKIFSDCLGK
ncbi:MAG: pilin [Patescibacteria group bacterium]|nr:pilin [Patescibacteria group bacterium]